MNNHSSLGNKERAQLLSDETTHLVMQILMYGVTPTISTLGVLGNVFSIIVLLKHGLHKCSNILLFCLAIGDLVYLIAFNSVPKLLYELSGVAFAWDYNEVTAHTLFVLYSIFHFLDYAIGLSSLAIPMLITAERLVAVFLPMKFSRIITPARTWTAVGIICLFWIIVIFYSSLWSQFKYVFYPKLNISMGIIERSDRYFQEQDVGDVLEEMIKYLTLKIPPGLTLVGCVIIAVKIKMASAKRRKMTSNGAARETKSNRTSKILLSVCAMYTVTCAIVSLPNYLPQYGYYTMTGDAPNNVGRIGYQFFNIVGCTNSSCNFIVYVGMNKNFRDTWKSLFTPCGYIQKTANRQDRKI
ncbi:probable G-protein coupled receptor B0563.6 [Aplysia californica]|uniref:Probable G-protein coupled receptor B0563.6 n=1 Tax=Aplysia californica TaxID=6500 RepID=A0ABM0JYX1_APLCA|nr:probable G-protein coupled receptor B0563.6 [Aplysia californica]